MENLIIESDNVRNFLKINSGSGSGSGGGYGYGFGFGSGFGGGYGDGSGSGSGLGGGYGDGSGFGSGLGGGSGSGSGSGLGGGDGDGDDGGFGSGYGISMCNGRTVHMIDGIATIIKCVFSNYARGFVLRSDLSQKPCYIAKNGNTFAHGDTLAEAVRALNDKLFDDMDEDERIATFWECHENGVKYPAMDLYEWHHKLTGSCEMGRKNFAAERGIDLDRDEFTVDEFIKLCRNSYGGEIILKLKEAQNEMEAKKE